MRAVPLLEIVALVVTVLSSSSVLTHAQTTGTTCATGETLCYDNPNVANPFCIEAGSKDKCCKWVHPFTTVQTATRCPESQECCDIAVPIITTSPFGGYCCVSGSTCCKASTSPSVFGSSACCPAGGKCCQGSSFGFCCTAEETCDLEAHDCIPPGGRTPAPDSNTPSPPLTCATGETLCGDTNVANQFCIEAGSTDKCCQWDVPFSTLRTASRCHANQECCGISAAQAANTFAGFCCNAGSSCCTAANTQNLFATAACCPSTGKCCRGNSYGFCCAATENCDVNAHLCVSGSGNPPGNPPAPGPFGPFGPAPPRSPFGPSPFGPGNPQAPTDVAQPGSSPTTAAAGNSTSAAVPVLSAVVLTSSAVAALVVALA